MLQIILRDAILSYLYSFPSETFFCILDCAPFYLFLFLFICMLVFSFFYFIFYIEVYISVCHCMRFAFSKILQKTFYILHNLGMAWLSVFTKLGVNVV